LCITAKRAANVRFGSKADIAPCPRHVRFTPESGQAKKSQQNQRLSFAEAAVLQWLYVYR
jgi:hypothetical protein